MRKEIVELQDFINTLVEGKPTIKVLEAGCGSESHLHFRNEAFMVGIDISEKQLQRNVSLNERILGDIQNYNFQSSSFDVIVCWDVLEHLPRPEHALYSFALAVKKEGVVILKLPNVYSLKGLLTKFLPHPLHLLVYRLLHQVSHPGTDDMGPFKTYLKFSLAPARIEEFAASHGLRVVYFRTYDLLSADWFRRNKMAHAIYKMSKAFLKFVSLGKLSDSEFIMVMQKALGQHQASAVVPNYIV